MNVREHKGATAAGSVGAVVLIAHLGLGAVGLLVASRWLSGAVIGLVLVAAATLQLVRPRKSGERAAP